VTVLILCLSIGGCETVGIALILSWGMELGYLPNFAGTVPRGLYRSPCAYKLNRNPIFNLPSSK